MDNLPNLLSTPTSLIGIRGNFPPSLLIPTSPIFMHVPLMLTLPHPSNIYSLYYTLSYPKLLIILLACVSLLFLSTSQTPIHQILVTIRLSHSSTPFPYLPHTRISIIGPKTRAQQTLPLTPMQSLSPRIRSSGNPLRDKTTNPALYL